MDDEVIRKEKKIRELPVKLTAKERQAAAIDMAEHCQLVQELDSELEELKAGYSSSKKTLEEQRGIHERHLRDNADAVKTGTRNQDVECECLFDYKADALTVTRLDTKEVIEERKLSAEEKQLQLDMEDGE